MVGCVCVEKTPEGARPRTIPLKDSLWAWDGDERQEVWVGFWSLLEVSRVLCTTQRLVAERWWSYRLGQGRLGHEEFGGTGWNWLSLLACC